MTSITLPDWDMQSSSGSLNLSKQPSTWLILYFYPKDATSGCTTQANEFSHLQAEFNTLNAQVFGISRDSIKSHERFIEKQAITFSLISDPDEKLCQHFDVIKEKNMYGKKVMGIERSTFIFKDNQLVKAFRKVKAAGHAELILNEIKQLDSLN